MLFLVQTSFLEQKLSITIVDRTEAEYVACDMLQTTLTAKFPRDQSEGGLWRYLSELVLPGSTGETTPPAIQPVQLPNPLSLALPKANSVFSAEFTNALFGIGKLTPGYN